MAAQYDVIVIGLGAMGTATCHHLARKGARVLGLEQFGIPHANGSSTGFSRMIRMSYHEHVNYVALLRSAFALWRDLERESGQKILHVTGGLYMGAPENAALRGAMRAAREFGLPHELLDAAALAKRFPQFHLPRHYRGMLEANAGFILPELSIASHAILSLRAGADLRGHEKVRSWSSAKTGVRVTTDLGTYQAAQLVLCGGAWTDALVRDLGIPLRVTRQVLAWVWPKKPALFELGRLPVWQIYRADGSAHYGFPMMPDNPGFKLAHHKPGLETTADTVPRQTLPGDEATIRPILAKMIPAADGRLLALRTCLYTNSPDGHFIVDRHPHRPRVWLACGFSGHGFKFAPVIGQALADLATSGSTSHPIDFLGLARFAKS
ncbi:MAG: N-methyl-L-tryptophan oxidase [Verrucomicrobia bacterium]|nr:N-methyl-L-tryptophan oxidase [Verrucomicrobiota bacterium]